MLARSSSDYSFVHSKAVILKCQPYHFTCLFQSFWNVRVHSSNFYLVCLNHNIILYYHSFYMHNAIIKYLMKIWIFQKLHSKKFIVWPYGGPTPILPLFIFPCTLPLFIFLPPTPIHQSYIDNTSVVSDKK